MGIGIFYARAAATLLLPIALSATHPAQAQDYPDRAVKIVVPFAAGGPPNITAKINADVNEALRQPELQERLRKLSAETYGGSIEKTAKYLQEEVERWGNVIKAANVKLQ
ncbi:MAG: tripartite tricarboxylate transporter substrate-binding protein [Bradyrhizobium sp.]|nr:tripartite tricarboxylate transporter substrate-binding protein [Bradyrhizobium sp.]